MDNGIDVKLIMKYLILFIGCLILMIFFVINFVLVKRYVIIDESLILIKNGSKWIQVNKYDEDISKYKYSIIGDFGIKNDVMINYNSKNGSWYYTDSDYRDLDVNDVSLAYTDKFEGIKVADVDFSYYDENDDNLLKDVLGDRDISVFRDSVMKNSFDLNGDGKVETIYTFTNTSLNNYKGAKYSSIFGVSDGKVIGVLDDDSKRAYIVRSIADLDGDGNYEVIVSKGSNDVATFNTCYQIYSFKNNKFSRIMDCK